MHLSVGLTPLTSVPFTSLAPTQDIDTAAINGSSTSLVFAAVAMRIPLAAPSSSSISEGPLLAIVNATIDTQVDAVGTATIRVAAVSASIADPAASLEVLGASLSAVMNTTVSEVLLVEAFVAANATATTPSSALSPGSIVVDGSSFNVTTRDDGSVQRQPFGASLVAIRPRTQLVVVERNVSISIVWISFNKSVSNSSTRCTNITVTYMPRPSNSTTVFNCTTMFEKLANVTTVAVIPPATIPGLLNFSATVSRSAVNFVFGSRPSTTGDGLLRHLTAVDIRNHQTRSVNIQTSYFCLSMIPVDFSDISNATTTTQRFVTNASAALIYIENNNVSFYPELNENVLFNETKTAVSINAVTSIAFSTTAAKLHNINLPCSIMVEQTAFTSLPLDAVSGGTRSGSLSAAAAALVSISFVPFQSVALSPFVSPPSLDIAISDCVLVGRGGQFPLVQFKRFVVALSRAASSTTTSRRYLAASEQELRSDMTISLPSVNIEVQRSTLQGISSVLPPTQPVKMEKPRWTSARPA
ncbi:Hypothetical protein, putative [Bodo saltans]|uniref:Uncharacterized protein n=1 Tax=Bodo saltans TaxID=75058 RepID=A0A0S4JSC9_BODSA|nr:Hypothetical protein, putative [Bodo saltans]|eukprot:CUG92233.1 Hypothetical protein, putative [Bodo saltans]